MKKTYSLLVDLMLLIIISSSLIAAHVPDELSIIQAEVDTHSGLDYQCRLMSSLSRNPIATQLTLSSDFSATEICSVKHHTEATYQIFDWILGGEIYRAYQDPALTCASPYPFSVEVVYMLLYFDKPATIYVSVDIVTADLSVPACPIPGELLSASSEYPLSIPTQGIYLFAIPLDYTAVVNEPYFAGFHISNSLISRDYAYQDSIALITDNAPELCRNYYKQHGDDEYIDLCNNEYYSFPGKILLYSEVIEPDFVCGDGDGDMKVNILDIIYVINYMYKNGPAPIPLESVDVNSDLDINILDIVYLINYKYKNGPEPDCP